MRQTAAVLVLLCSALHCGAQAQRGSDGSTLRKVQNTQELSCGVVHEDAEYSTEEDHSSRGGFDEGLCGAIAVAASPQTRVKLTSFLDEVSAVQALRAGRLDVIASLSADPEHRYRGTQLSRTVFYDGLALLTSVAGGLKKPGDFAGEKICVLAETGNEEALRRWYARQHVDYLPFPFQEEGEMEAAYVSNNCAALAAERTRLSLIRVSLGSGAAEHVILPEALSRDPMAMATRQGDAQWSAVAGAVVRSLLVAEQLGLRLEKSNRDDAAFAELPALEEHMRATTQTLGLRPTWATDVFRSVGSYSDLYERTLGSGSDRQLVRDANRLRADGGALETATRRDVRALPARRSSRPTRRPSAQ